MPRQSYPLGLDAAGCQQIRHILAELSISIQNRMAVRTRFRECFPQLLHYPGTGRVFPHIEMEDLASAMFDNEEAIQKSKGERWNGKEIHCSDDIKAEAATGTEKGMEIGKESKEQLNHENGFTAQRTLPVTARAD
jgi:hypothetical protein